MNLPRSLRKSLTEDLEDFLEESEPDEEVVVGYLIELIETFADEYDLDDIVVSLEESGALEVPLSEGLEEEMSSNDEFELTGEEVVTLFEQLCVIDWVDDDEFNDDDDDDEEDDEDELD